ncbi:hypothetical protein [Butyricicoccus pullicaecorum]|uniref:hypothetical protein n=1 Tax=Butyricicoccus pullicaecorum TaxID=501571 RepID=UPI003990A0E8
MLGMISDVIIQAEETKVKNKYHLQKKKIRQKIWAILPCGFWAQKNRSFRRKSG